MAGARPSKRYRHGLKLLGRGFLGLLALLALLLVAALLAVNTRWGRARLVAAANATLADSFRGSVHLTRLGFIGLDGVQDVEGRVLDPGGRTVILVRGLDVDVGLFSLVWSLVGGNSGSTHIALDSVRADDVRLRLVDAGAGVPSLAKAFESAQPSPPGETPSRTSVAIDQIYLSHVWAYGQLAGTPIDVDLGTLEAKLGVDARSLAIELKQTKLWVRALPSGVEPRGHASGRLALPLEAPGDQRSVQVHYRGTAWGVRGDARVSLRGVTLNGTVRTDEIRPEQLSTLLSLEHAKAPVALRAHLSGTLEQPKVVLDLDGKPGQLRAELNLDRTLRQLTVEGKLERIDLSRWDPALPPSRLNVAVRAQAGYSEAGSLQGTYWVRVAGARLESTRLPDSELEGEVRLSDSGHYKVTGSGAVEEPGAPTRLHFSVSGRGGAAKVQLHGSSTIDDPSRLAALVPDLSVAGDLDSDLEFEAATGRFAARVHGRLTHVRAPNLRAADLALDARASGSAERPQLALTADFGSLAVRGRKYESGSIRASGTPDRLKLQARAEGEASAKLTLVARLTPRVELSDLELALEGEAGQLQVQAKQLRMSGAGVVARDVSLSTEHGRARLSFAYDAELEELDLSTEQLNIAELLQALHLEAEPLRGVATLETHLERTARGLRGFVKGRVERLGYGPVDDASVRVDAQLRRGLVSGGVEGTWKDSRLEVELTRLPYAALPAARLQALTGSADIRAELSLGDFEPLVDLWQAPVETMGGHVSLNVAWRQGQDEPARLDAALATDGLELVGEREPVADDASGAAAQRAAPWSLDDTDLVLDLSVDESTRQLALRATVKDEHGALAKTSTQVRLPAGRAAWDYHYWRTAWPSAEFESTVWVLPRKLSEWPAWARVSELDGALSLSLGMRGTYRSPQARWMASIEHFGATEDETRRLSVMASGDYARERGALRLAATDRGRRVLDIDAEWLGDALGYGLRGENPRQLKVAGRLDQLPTSALPLPGTQRLTGPVSGNFSVEGFAGPWRGNVKLTGRDLVYAGFGIDHMRLNASLERGRLNSELRVYGDGLGRVDAELEGETPALGGDEHQPLRAKVKARNFQLRALRPLFSGTVSGLEGAVTADVSGVLSKVNPDLSGHVELRHGAAQFPQLGQMFHDIEAKLSLQKDQVRLERLTAKGLTGELHATGDAELDGMQLLSARARLKIPEKEKLPLTIEGVSMGDAWGRASVHYRPINERRNRLDLDVDEFHLDLPEVTPRGVQSLDPAPRIDVGFFRNDGKFVQIPLQPVERQNDSGPTRWTVHIGLGSVEVKKGQGVKIQLKGDLKARVGKKTRWTGSIDLTGGTLDVSGKEFTIERGSISFDHRPLEAGVVTARARWDSPLEYTVYAEYAGTVDEGELKLRSEPPLTEDEILGLILFGTPGGNFGAREQNDAATAVSIAGSTVTRGLNRALADFSQLDVSTRVDTSTGEARPELVVQISPRVTARVTQAIGEAPPGQSPDRTFLTVDLRLFRRWSISAQVGDAGGSSLDMIWRQRY